MSDFDPFNDRVARDLRNHLATAMVAALVHDDGVLFTRMVADWAGRDLGPVHRRYLAGRRESFDRLIAGGIAGGAVWEIAVALWNEGLFFEVHEILEDAWREADGEEKEVLQAMIRAAGVQVHLAAGNDRGARKMAKRAHSALARHRDHLPFANGDALISTLAGEHPEAIRLERKGSE